MRKIQEILQSISVELYVSALAIVFVLLGVIAFTYVVFANDLKSKDTIMNRNDTGVILTDRNGKPFFSLYQAKQHALVPLASIPKVMQDAVIASEDKDYYSHPGFSIKGTLRALFYDIWKKDSLYGGSTITQQLVKNALLTPKKSFLRKFQEIVLAQEIERRYTKGEILEMYLNSVYFGEGAFGVGEAAERYFGKDIRDINLPEASMLAAILPAPTRYSPLSGSLAEATTLQHLVLDRMQEQGYITVEQKNTTEAKPVAFNPKRDIINSQALHFAIYVKDQLIKKYGEEYISRSGFRVRTSIDLAKQDYAEKTVAEQVENLKPNNVSNGAAVVMDPKTGEILAMVGSKDWYDDKFGRVNMALAPRSPGSSFKPIVYAAGFEEQIITPASVLRDEPITFPGNYKPQDYDRKYRGKVLVRRALANSLNIPAVDLLSKVGVPDALDMARRLGVTTLKDPSNYGLSLVLGTGEVPLLEMTDVYSVFANKGVLNKPVSILSITDKGGKVVYQYKPSPERVLDEDVAFLISSILSDNQARAEEFGNALTIPRVAAVKTGTAEDYRDALTLGYTPSLVVGVWVGNNDNRPMDQIAGSLGAAPIWKNIMTHSLADTPEEAFAEPQGIVERSICKSDGLLVPSQNASSAAIEYFIDGTGPTRYCYSQHIADAPKMTLPPITVTPLALPTIQPTGAPPPRNEDAIRIEHGGHGKIKESALQN